MFPGGSQGSGGGFGGGHDVDRGSGHGRELAASGNGGGNGDAGGGRGGVGRGENGNGVGGGNVNSWGGGNGNRGGGNVNRGGGVNGFVGGGGNSNGVGGENGNGWGGVNGNRGGGVNGNRGGSGNGNGVGGGNGNAWGGVNGGRGGGGGGGNGIFGGGGNGYPAEGGFSGVGGGGNGIFGAGGGRGGVGGVGRGNAGAGGRGRGRGRENGIRAGHIAIEELLAHEARRMMPVLHPERENGAMWFGIDNPPRRVIVASIRRHFDGPWFNMSSVPNDTIIQWWGEFIQAFYWDPVHTAMVYQFWYNITAARLRDMVSKAKVRNEKPEWISLGILDNMWTYWNSDEGKRKSVVGSANRMSHQFGYGPYRHTAWARSFNQVRDLIRRREGIEPSMLRVLRETHRKPDGTYVDRRAQYIDEEIHRQLQVNEILGSETQSFDGTGVTGLTQEPEDDLYLKVVDPYQSGRIFGMGGYQSIREREESSNMGATRLTLQRQVTVLQEQLAAVMEAMKRYIRPNGEGNGDGNVDGTRTSTPQTRASVGGSGPPRVQRSDLEASLEEAINDVYVPMVQIPNQDASEEENEELEEDGDGHDPNEYAAA